MGAVNALVFGTYTYFMQHQAQLKGIPYDESSAPLQHVFLAGMGSGIVSRYKRYICFIFHHLFFFLAL